MADSKAELEAQLRALEEQLERKRIEEEIRQLQAQLEQVEAQEEEYYDEEYEEIIEEEEVTEEYEEYEDEEIIEEYVEEEEPASPRPIARQRPATSTSKTSPRRFKPKLSANNPFTRNLEAKRAAEEKKAKEKAARAMEGQPKPKSASKEVDPANLPDLPPFTPRTIPKLPASPAGEETPMEKLLGPKLYKQGKLIATTTVAGCTDMDLILLFFGSYWNRECKPFYALMDDFYKITAIPHKIECIYISCDKTLQMFKDCFKTMPFLAMPPGTSDLKNHMARELKLVDVPVVVVLDPNTGHVITTKGAEQIEALQRRNVDQCNQLVDTWKRTEAIAFEEVKKDPKLKHGTMDMGFLMWSE